MRLTRATSFGARGSNIGRAASDRSGTAAGGAGASWGASTLPTITWPRMHVDVFDRDLLLCLAAMSVEDLYLAGEHRHQFRREFQIAVAALVRLILQHLSPQAFHRRVVRPRSCFSSAARAFLHRAGIAWVLEDGRHDSVFPDFRLMTTASFFGVPIGVIDNPFSARLAGADCGSCAVACATWRAGGSSTWPTIACPPA